jgi:hypothetical protein
MVAPAACDECRKIKLELREAWMDAWLETDPEFRAAWLGLFGGPKQMPSGRKGFSRKPR